MSLIHVLIRFAAYELRHGAEVADVVCIIERHIEFPPPWYCPVNAACIVTLAGGYIAGWDGKRGVMRRARCK